jgi:hypothetical protein
VPEQGEDVGAPEGVEDAAALGPILDEACRVEDAEGSGDGAEDAAGAPGQRQGVRRAGGELLEDLAAEGVAEDFAELDGLVPDLIHVGLLLVFKNQQIEDELDGV